MSLTQEEADFLVNEIPKSIGEPIVWIPRDRKNQRSYFSVRVIALTAATSDPLQLRGVANPRTWSYVLLGPQNEQIRKISTPHSGHTHPDKTIAEDRHKHFWGGDLDADRWTYVPNDIRWDNPTHALVDFLAECRITSQYEVPDFPVQLSLGKE